MMRAIQGAMTMRRVAARCILAACCLLTLGAISCSEMPASSEDPVGGLIQSDPEDAGFVAARMKLIDDAVETAIAAGELPGAVVVVGRRGRIAYLKAFGAKRALPARNK